MIKQIKFVSIPVADQDRALDFYRTAFGATELMRLEDPSSGNLWHAEIKIGDAAIAIAGEENCGRNCPICLTAIEAENVFAKSIVQHKKFDLDVILQDSEMDCRRAPREESQPDPQGYPAIPSIRDGCVLSPVGAGAHNDSLKKIRGEEGRRLGGLAREACGPEKV